MPEPYYKTHPERVKEYRSRPEVKKRRNKITKIWNKENLSSVLLTKARKRARDYNVPINITKDDIIVPEICPVLGIPLAYSDGKVSAGSPTIDRIIPEKGYVKGNIAVISYRANRLKSDASLIELERITQWVKTQSN